MAGKRKSGAGKRDLARKALQLRISLVDVEPEIWRRFVVPADIPLSDLHEVLQLVMGWLDCHLHRYRFRRTEYGNPDLEPDSDIRDEWPKRLHQLVEVGDEFGYEYDYGDGWRHVVAVEAVEVRSDHKYLPVCLEGARRGPPEDVGGTWGYKEFLEAYLDPEHDEHEMYVGWIGPNFDPNRFDLAGINRNLRRLAAGRKPHLPTDDARWS